MPMPPRATSSSSSYEPKARGRTGLPTAFLTAPPNGPVSSRALTRHFVHSPRGASDGNSRPHLGQNAVFGDSDVNVLYPVKVRSRSVQTFRKIFPIGTA